MERDMLRILRERNEAVARDGIIAAYVDGERLLIKEAGNFFGGRGNQDQMTAGDLEGMRAGIDDGRPSVFDAFPVVFGGRPGLRRRIEVVALGELCGMYVELLHDEQSSPEFKIFAKARLERFCKRQQALTEV